MIPCQRFYFKEQMPQTRALDWYRRRVMASPISEYTAPGALVEVRDQLRRTGRDEGLHRVARAGRDRRGVIMDIHITLNDKTEGVTVRSTNRGQTQRAVVGGGRHRLSISYRAHGVSTANAETTFSILDGTLRNLHQLVRAPLPLGQAEFVHDFETPPELAGNIFEWEILYDGRGVFELHEVSFQKVDL